MTSPIEMVLSLRQTRRGRQPKIPKAPRRPTGKTLERKYQAELRRLIRPMRTLVNELLLPQLEQIGRMAGVGMRRDARVELHARRVELCGRVVGGRFGCRIVGNEIRLDVEPWVDAVAAIMERIRSQYDAATAAEIESIVAQMGSQSNAFNASAVQKQIGAMLGIDIAAEVPGLAGMLESWAVDNVGLIKSISQRYFQEIEGMVLRSFNAGTRAEDLSVQIRARYGVSESRANLIARDQISKLQGDLTRQRQTALGIEKYRWRTSRDERVRAFHRKLNGKVFSWDNPPKTNKKGDRNHPGGDYQCRCTADPEIADLLD